MATTSTTTTTTTSSANNASLSKEAILYMVLLAIQFGIQPMVTKAYTPSTVSRSTVILCQEGLKFWLALGMLLSSGKQREALQGWTIATWIHVAGIPAILYSIQNIAALMAYQNLDALTFNVLNQTKTLSAALCCYLVMGKSQSYMQMVALLVLLMSALVMEGLVTTTSTTTTTTTTTTDLEREYRIQYGVIPILVASFISGLAGALCQVNLQSSKGGGRNPYLYSMELCAASSICLILSMIYQSMMEDVVEPRIDGEFWNGWTLSMWIPILTNSIGGILVGLVTKYAGSVQKGFALIFGIFLSGVLQQGSSNNRVSREQMIGGVLAAVSLWMHATYPPASSPKAIADGSKSKVE